MNDKTGELKIWHEDKSISSVSLSRAEVKTLLELVEAGEEASHNPLFADRREAVVALYNKVVPLLLNQRRLER